MNPSSYFKAVSLALALSLTAPLQAGEPPAGPSTVEVGKQKVVPGRYIVVFKDDVSNPSAAARQMARAHGLAPDFVYTTAIKGFAANMPERAANALLRDPRVDHVTQDLVAHTLAQTVPTGIARSNADTVLDGHGTFNVDGNDDRVDVDVAVFDSGIADHPDLNIYSKVDCSGGGPFGGGCSEGSAPDGNGHGTHVAGTIAALDNNIGVVGVAPGARLWAVRILNNQGSGYLSWILGGIEWIAANENGEVDVANMSIGFSSSVPDVCTAIANLPSHIVVAVAAGNSDKDAGTVSPADCANHPGANVITVSALADFNGLPGGGAAPTCRTDVDDTLANFSNWGATVGIAAPGVCINSTWNDGGYNEISGTSMASPHVAGAAALLASSASPPTDIVGHLIATGNLNWFDDSGDGIQEPLLDVTGYQPQYVTTTPPENQPPSIAVANPLNGTTVSGTITVQILASDPEDDDNALPVTWAVDGVEQSAPTYNSGNGYYEGSWNTSGLTAGSPHTISASVADFEGLIANASSNVTIFDPLANTDVTTTVACVQWGGKGGNLHLAFEVAVDDLVSTPIANATVEATITLDGGSFWYGSAVTDSTGTVSFDYKKATVGDYHITIDDITGTNLNWVGGHTSGDCNKS